MKGFTVIELLVVLAISALLSTLAITYSSVSRNYVALSVQESKLTQLILQAKALSIATYASGNGSAACGYGVVISTSTTPQTYSIFVYHPAGTPPCPTETTAQSNGISAAVEQSSTSATWQVPIAQGVKIQSGSNNLAAVLFYPPNPDTLLSSDGKTFENPEAPLNIYLVTIDGKNTATLTINAGGQVSQ
jgi:prepilin-type N-terminal cleavage/methylation domain-containing protein